MYLNNPIPLKIHCWGGFGSQLHALILALQIDRTFQRKFILVFHTGGVTRRNLEIEALLQDFDFIVENDFIEAAKLTMSPELKSAENILIKLIKGIAYKLNFVSKFENSDSIKSLKFWTLSLRGHYSNLQFDKECYQELFLKLEELSIFESNFVKSNQDDWIVHYRLGDLLQIDKNYILPKTIVKYFQESKLPKSIILLSDSPEIALDFLNSEFKALDLDVQIRSEQLSSVSTLVQCVRAKNFLGTTSKISIWATVLRESIATNGTTVMPISLSSNINSMVKISGSNFLVFFETET